MSKDDYFVIVYKILDYQYSCLKNCESADMDYLKCETDDFPVGLSYWEYIFEHLLIDTYDRAHKAGQI